MLALERRSLVLALAVVLAGAGCETKQEVTPPPGTATVIVRAPVSPSAVATVVVTVTAPDIPTPLVFNLAIASGVATGTLALPTGANRTITLQAFDAGGIETDSGSVTVNVQPGTNSTITMVLTPLSGNVGLNLTLGTIKITVTPTPNTISVGGSVNTVQLSASIKDSQGNPVTGTVSWATHDPGIASVSTTGLVSAVGVGTTNIFATFQGAVGSAAITVTP